MKTRNSNLFPLIVLLACFSAPHLFAKPEVKPIAKQERGEIASQFRIGPFFEYRETDRDEYFWALRPFYSHQSDPHADTEVSDFVWPLSTWHRQHVQSWWRFLLAYGSDDNIHDEDAGWKVALFPFYFQGKNRFDEEYWALFPIYGHFPHILLMDDIDFVLFPFYLKYEINGRIHRFHPWPFYSRTEGERRVEKKGVFPIHGSRKHERGTFRYTLWPFWTSTTYTDERNPGESWMLWPICGSIDREREKQTLILPPFFSHVKTDQQERWRMPWPFYESLDGSNQVKRSYWPIYGYEDREDQHGWYAAWPFLGGLTLETEEHRLERNRVFPFYLHQEIWHTPITQPHRRDPKVIGKTYREESYTRVWPFYSYIATPTRNRFRFFDFAWVRYSEPIERNWAALWTLYERVETERRITHDILWGLIHFTQEKGPVNKEAEEPR